MKLCVRSFFFLFLVNLFIKTWDFQTISLHWALLLDAYTNHWQLLQDMSKDYPVHNMKNRSLSLSKLLIWEKYFKQLEVGKCFFCVWTSFFHLPLRCLIHNYWYALGSLDFTSAWFYSFSGEVGRFCCRKLTQNREDMPACVEN